MPWDEIQSNWAQYRRRLRTRWGRLADWELEDTAGDRERLVAKIAEVYDIGRDRAEREVMEFEGEQRRSGGPHRPGDGARPPGRDEEE
jgi:uncharacterized protein YjbJ (UPF0337 family)